MECKKCSKCGATWYEGVHYWTTGAKGSEADLAGLVCDNLLPEDTSECINPLRGTNHTGDTWEYRRGYSAGLMDEFNRANEIKKQQ